MIILSNLFNPPGFAYPGVRDNRSTINTKTGYDDDECRGDCGATLNNMKLVHWPLMGGQLYLVQRGGDWVGPQPVQSSPCCTKCYSLPINGQCTNFILLDVVCCCAVVMCPLQG